MESVRYLLKTPQGYLTPDGTTNDINNNDIIILNIIEIGGVGVSDEDAINNFLKLSKSTFNTNECTILWYSCAFALTYYCNKCDKKRGCEFWTDRSKCRIKEH